MCHGGAGVIFRARSNKIAKLNQSSQISGLPQNPAPEDKVLLNGTLSCFLRQAMTQTSLPSGQSRNLLLQGPERGRLHLVEIRTLAKKGCKGRGDRRRSRFD
jgi:hypothetical protein